jgi:transcriptional regulator with XRE-family HTH domain
MYELSKLTGVPQFTLATIMTCENAPRVDTLERICIGLGITLSDYFAEEKTELEPELSRFSSSARRLNSKQRNFFKNFWQP